MQQLRRAGPVLVALLVVAGCAMRTGEDERAPEYDPDTHRRDESIVGSRTRTPFPVVSVHVPEGRIHTGVIVDERLILVHELTVLGWNPKEIRVRHWDLSSGRYEERTPTHVDGDGDHALLRLSRGFPNARPWNLVKGVDPEGGQGALDCVAFDPVRPGVLYDAWMEVSSVSLPEFHVVPASIGGEHLEDEDLGAPCFQEYEGTLFGVSLGVPNRAFPEESEMRLVSSLGDWLDDMRNLDYARREARRTMSLRNEPVPGAELCMAGGWRNGDAVYQSACWSSAITQRFHWTDVPGRSDYYALVNASTGKCVEVAGGGLGSGTPLVVNPCHWGPSQRFDLTLHDPQATGLKVVTMPDFGDTRCLSAVGGPQSGNANLESRTCQTGVTNNLDQRWLLRFH